MDYGTLAQMVGSVGFPIVAAAAMFYLYNNTINNLVITLNKIDSTLENIMGRLDRLESED